MPNSLLKKYKSLYSSTANSFSTGTGVTVTPASVVGLPTDTEITLTFDRVNSSGVSTPTVMERIVGSISGGNLAIRTTDPVSGGALSGRGFDSSTEQSHTSPVVEHIWNAGDWNDLVTHLTTEHNQDGSHKQITNLTNNTPITMKDVGGTKRALNNLNTNNVQELGVAGTSALNDQYLSDTGTANTYAVTCAPVPVAYVTGMRFRFKAGNANSGASTLNVNALGVKTIKRYGTTDLSSGDILAGQIVEAIYDGTNFLLTGSTVFGGASDWTAYTAVTPTTGTLDAPSFPIVFAGVDLTGVLYPGMRVKITQSTVKYFIITKVAFSTDTTVTLYGGTDFSLVASGTTAISAFSYSGMKSPAGFNPDPIKWTETLKDSTARTQGSPVQNTIYNLTGAGLAIPIGSWRVEYFTNCQLNASAGNYGAKTTLSTANNTESDTEFTALQQIVITSSSGNLWFTKAKHLTLTAKTSYFLNYISTSSGPTVLYANNDISPSFVRAVCAYL